MNKTRSIAFFVHTFAIVTYLLVGHFKFGMERPGHLYTWFFAVFVGMMSEFLFRKFYKVKNANPYASSRISSSAVYLVVTSPYWYLYGVLSFIAIASKWIFRTPKGEHVFNPANIAILVGVCLFPNSIIIDAHQFFNWYEFYLWVIFLGSITVILANRWAVVLSYVAGFALGSYCQSLLSPENFIFYFFQLLNSTNLIFMFHMLSDPMTSPSRLKKQIFFGVAVGVVDQILRYHWIIYSNAITLAAMTLVMSWINNIEYVIPSWKKYLRLLRLGDETSQKNLTEKNQESC